VRGSLLGIAVACAAGGCLNFGGKTYVHESPTTESRLLGLETRVQALEHAVGSLSAPTAPYAPGEPILSQRNDSRQPPGAPPSGFAPGQ
jgi:hypothetical protein